MPEPSIPLPTIVTAAVALYGAVLSTLNYVLARKEKTRRLRVRLYFGFITSGPNLSEQMLFISASNPGMLSVTLSAVGVALPDGKNAFFPVHRGTSQLPYELAGGKEFQMWTELKDFADSMREKGYVGKIKIRGFYNDQSGGTHKSKSRKLDLDTC